MSQSNDIFDIARTVSAKSIFSASFNAILRHLELSQEANLFYWFLFNIFPATAITSAADNFLVICFHILKGLAIYYRYLACKFHMGFQGTFLPQIGHEVKKPEGNEGEPPFSFLKNSYIMKLMPPPPKKPFLDQFPSFFCQVVFQVLKHTTPITFQFSFFLELEQCLHQIHSNVFLIADPSLPLLKEPCTRCIPTVM